MPPTPTTNMQTHTHHAHAANTVWECRAAPHASTGWHSTHHHKRKPNLPVLDPFLVCLLPWLRGELQIHAGTEGHEKFDHHIVAPSRGQGEQGMPGGGIFDVVQIQEVLFGQDSQRARVAGLHSTQESAHMLLFEVGVKGWAAGSRRCIIIVIAIFDVAGAM